MGVDLTDYNNDGWPALMTTDLAKQRFVSYLNGKDGSFTFASDTNGIGGMTLTHSGWGSGSLTMTLKVERTCS